MTPPLLCHLQIAKAGTNSFKKILDDNVPRDRLAVFKIRERKHYDAPITVDTPLPAIAEFIEDLRARQDHLEAVSMMLPYGIHAKIDRDVRYISVLREPISRCLSALNFVHSRRTTHPFAARYSALGFSPRRLVDSGDLTYCNDQVRFLSGAKSLALGLHELEEARRNLQRDFAVVGVVERFDALACSLKGAFGWVSDADIVLNKGQYSEPLGVTAADLDALQEANQLDLSLYRWVTRELLNGASAGIA